MERNFLCHVITELGTGIVAGRFPVGSILPNDVAMMDMYGGKGLVEARP